jgi:spore coat protein CotH
MKRIFVLMISACVGGGTVLSGQVAREQSFSEALRPRLLGIGPQPSDYLFNDSVLHEIRLTINPADWQSLKDHYLENLYYPCDLEWAGQVIKNVGIRSRGWASRSDTKPGLRVDFDRYVRTQTFLGLKSFVLRNNTQEPSAMNERVSMQMFRRMGLPAPREAHTALFVNGEYVGLYTIVESVDKAFLRRQFFEDAGYLYDFQFEGNSYYFEYRGQNPAVYVPFPFKPDTHETSPEPQFIERLIWTINETPDDLFREAITTFLDLGVLVRHVAVEMFMADFDGFAGEYGANNFYLYRFAGSSRFTLIPWDKSHAFSHVDYGIFHNLTDVPLESRNRLMARALTYPDLYDRYLDALLECAAIAEERQGETGPGWLSREIDRVHEQIREAALADSFKPFTNEQFEQAVSDLRTFARYRAASVLRQVNDVRPPPPPPTESRRPVNGRRQPRGR